MSAQAQAGQANRIFGDFGNVAKPAPAASVPLQIAQASDAAYRVQQLEEEVRQLTGKVEELNFQLLQMQEQMRKMQEDNEFRFQQLEGGSNVKQRVRKSDAGKQQVERTTEAQQPKPESNNDQIAGIIQRESDAPAQQHSGKTIDGVEIYQSPSSADQTGGLRPETLGKLIFDQNGNVVDSQVDKPIDLTGPNRVPTGQQGTVASLELPTDPDQLYNLGYNYIQSGDYALAEDAFQTFSERFPNSPRIAEARFWVGESLLSRGMYQDAAKVLLEAHKKYPDSRMGPQTLLKLGVSLAGMNQRELACATFAEVPKQYPQISGAIRAKVVAEQKAASCKAG
jgi:tol-pal system protein YbgF